jgi:hypothetical protein
LPISYSALFLCVKEAVAATAVLQEVGTVLKTKLYLMGKIMFTAGKRFYILISSCPPVTGKIVLHNCETCETVEFELAVIMYLEFFASSTVKQLIRFTIIRQERSKMHALKIKYDQKLKSGKISSGLHY